MQSTLPRKHLQHGELRSLLNGRFIKVKVVRPQTIRIMVNNQNVKVEPDVLDRYTDAINMTTSAPFVRELLTVIDAPIDLELKVKGDL